MTDALPKLGITATIPVEVALAAGWAPLDLNNLFVTRPDSSALLQGAEAAGLPRNVCAWIRGIYAAAELADPEVLVAVVRGDCTNSEALAELWRHRGRRVIGFSYPYRPEPALVATAIDELCAELGTTRAAAEAWRARLEPIRADLRRLDDLCWREGRASGRECFDWQLGSSDFRSDPEEFGRGLAALLERASRRPPRPPRIRLGLAGVPPAVLDLPEALDELGADLVFFETPRQFSMPYQTADLAEQYARYSYPYPLPMRLADVRAEAARRGLHGLIHYVQTFCFHSIEHVVLRETAGLPVLLIEGDEPGPMDERTRTRLQAFLERLDCGS